MKKNAKLFLNLLPKGLRFSRSFLISVGYVFIDSYSFFKIKILRIKLPKVHFPKFSFPRFPTLHVSNIKVAFPRPPINLKVRFPKLPIVHIKIRLPKLHTIRLKLTLPNFHVGRLSKFSKKFKTLYRAKRKPFVFKAKKLKPKIKSTKHFAYGVVFSCFFIFVPIFIYSWFQNLPDPGSLLALGSNRATKILDRNGKLLYEIYVDKKYDPVALDKIPDNVIKSTIAIEDSDFYNHHGIRLLSIVRAAKASFFDDNLQGGSTITQQLVKNVLLSPEQTFSRKLKEIVLSLMVERKYSKNQIMELYLNNISYGGTAWGIESAAQKYFGKDVWTLDLAEASLLAGLPTAPSVYAPLAGSMELSKQRQQDVLSRMVELKYIDQVQADNAYAEELNFVPQTDLINAPHFVSYVRDFLVNKYGERVVEYGGLTVTTSLDLDLQQKVQQIVKDEVARDKYLNISNGAAVVLDAKNGEILAYVGSKDYFAEGYGSFDILTAFRQPGSAIKPITYALALQKGYTSASIIDDAPIVYKNQWETYAPVNYDGKFHGKVTLRAALANSLNIPAVKLANAVGPDNIAALGQKLGLTGWSVDASYGLSITLGGKETRLLDLSNVYATFARGGLYKNVEPILSVKDINGKEIYAKDDESAQIIDSGVSYIITNILSDYYARIPEFGTANFLSIPGHTVAAKTGTTDSKRDNYTFGYTPSYAVGVWVGNNDNKPMNPYLASGLSGAAPMWNKIMGLVLAGKPNELFSAPTQVFFKYDKTCNRSEVFVSGSKIPSSLCPVEDKPKDSKAKKS